LVTGESFSGTIVTQDATTILVEVEATHIPQNFEVSVEGLEEGAQILARDVVLPKGATLVDDPELLLVAVSVPAAPSLGDTEGAAEAPAAAEEPAAAADEAAE